MPERRGKGLQSEEATIFVIFADQQGQDRIRRPDFSADEYRTLILLLKDIVHTGFKLPKRFEAVEYTLTNPVRSFVVMRVHGRRDFI
jgi:hypothetical protein